jgi:hypothetical protein
MFRFLMKWRFLAFANPEIPHEIRGVGAHAMRPYAMGSIDLT